MALMNISRIKSVEDVRKSLEGGEREEGLEIIQDPIFFLSIAVHCY